MLRHDVVHEGPLARDLAALRKQGHDPGLAFALDQGGRRENDDRAAGATSRWMNALALDFSIFCSSVNWKYISPFPVAFTEAS